MRQREARAHGAPDFEGRFPEAPPGVTTAEGQSGGRDAGLKAGCSGGRDAGLKAGCSGGCDAGLKAGCSGGCDAGPNAGCPSNYLMISTVPATPFTRMR